MKKRLALLFVSLIALASCDPRYFYINEEHPIKAAILSKITTVDHSLYTIELHDSAAVALTHFGWPEYRFRTGLRLISGEGIRLMLRPIYGRTVVDSGLVITLTRSGVTIDSAHRSVQPYQPSAIRDTSMQSLGIFCENNYLEVTLGCDTLIRHWTPEKESDDIVFSTIGNSEAILVAPDWRRIEY